MVKKNNYLTYIFLAIIGVFIILGINKNIKNHHEKAYTALYNKIKEVAKECYLKEECKDEITLKDLYNKELIDIQVDPITKEPLDETICLKYENKEVVFCK